MTPADFRRIRELFEAALDRTASDRQSWLASACGADSALKDQVERMLAAVDEPHHILDDRTDAAPASLTGGLSEGRFSAGALFTGRFRIIALQARGGMGEVYRAEDLELGQIVALKFLTAFRSDQRARSRLRTEVRLARQISHPNVCRVYDIGDADGELYLSMEYVEGEDLSTLLRQNGRVPVQEGIEIARKLCAGLAAAHVKGVLHRDLKPGNVMIDSRGEVRLMDFGLAAVVEQQLEASDIRSGTPAYMAPEQLAGSEASVRSDIYALGLVLYELFTGMPAFPERTAAELLRLRVSRPSVPPSTLVPSLDPTIERTILRCLDPDPRRRPASALDVAASLPGGDPLAEALAAGETPSPELVAAAGPDTGLRPKVAAALLVLSGACLSGVLLLTSQVHTVSMVPMENPPEMLAARAGEIVRSLGYGEAAADAAYGFRQERGYLEYVAARLVPGEAGLAQWRSALAARPAPVSFWYARSEGPIVPPVAGRGMGAARPIDSSPAIRGAVSVDLDLDGRLLRFVGTPATNRPAVIPTGDHEWHRLFAAAGLEMQNFTEEVQQSSASAQRDGRLAWTGSYPGRPDLPVRLEADVSTGTITSFEVRFPWTRRDPWFPEPTNYARAAILIVVWIAPLLVARYNWATGRADVRGALLIGLVAFVGELGFESLVAHDALNAFVSRPVLWSSLGSGAGAALAYIALEPWVRRWWPHALIGWARVVAGRSRDPLVARDVLIAVAISLAYRCAYLGGVLAGIQQGAPPLDVAGIGAVPGEFVLSHLAGPRFTAANILYSISGGIAVAAGSFFLLAFFRSLLRNAWLGIVAFCLLSFTWTALQPQFRGGWIVIVVYVGLALWTFVALRYGFLSVVVATCVSQLLAQSVLTTDLGAWYGRSSLTALLLVSALAIWAFTISLGSRRRVDAHRPTA